MEFLYSYETTHKEKTTKAFALFTSVRTILMEHKGIVP